MNLDKVRDQLRHWLEKNRGSLHAFDERIAEDCLELLATIESTKDENLKKIHLLDLSVKMTVFFTRKHS